MIKMKISTSGCRLIMIAAICWLGFGFQNSYGQSITSTSGSWFSTSTWLNGNAPGTIVGTSTMVVNPVFLDGSGGTLNLMSSGNINSIINAPITDNSSSG
jgi:hypothetical protein